MSSTEPPEGSIPPDPTVPPTSSTPPPPPPPPAPATSTPPPAATGGTRPGELVDRFVARLVDLILVGVVTGIIGLILAAISDSYLLAGFISAVVSAAISLGYFAYLESSRGQTLGKQLMKLKTVGPDGHSNPTMEQAVKRNLWTGLPILEIIPVLGVILYVLGYLAAVILCAVNINSNVPDRRTWFDNFAGGTQVLKIG